MNKKLTDRQYTALAKVSFMKLRLNMMKEGDDLSELAHKIILNDLNSLELQITNINHIEE